MARRGALAWAWLSALLLPLLLPAAAIAAAGPALSDDRGVELRFERTPQRIVSLLPSLTETVCALGACERIVGVDDHSNWPRQVQALPHVGGLEDANVERIVALKPDVVLLARSARVAPRLEALGLRVVALEPKSMADVERVLGKVGRLLGREPEAATLWRELQTGLSEVAAGVPAATRGLRVYFEVSSAPYAAGASSFIGETMSRLGAANIVPAELGPFPKLNPEYVVRADPQLIMIGERNAVALRERPGWERIAALRDRRVCVFTAAQGDVLVRPGPRMVEAARIMADCLRGPPR
ncbi:MAG: ABC transporter substrate-binding protein [Comamonadaceae bacterium]|nr:MAG: ABC transporter substrate-binding protein [Comamonadaceae bacterium]